MTDLITELEFTTLSRLKQLPELPEEDHDGHDRVQSAQLSRASSRHNLKDVHRLPDGQTISKDSPTTATREIIQAPPPFPADLDLDGASRRHVQALIHQNIENVGLKDRGWEVRGTLLTCLNDRPDDQAHGAILPIGLTAADNRRLGSQHRPTSTPSLRPSRASSPQRR